MTKPHARTSFSSRLTPWPQLLQLQAGENRLAPRAHPLGTRRKDARLTPGPAAVINRPGRSAHQSAEPRAPAPRVTMTEAFPWIAGRGRPRAAGFLRAPAPSTNLSLLCCRLLLLSSRLGWAQGRGPFGSAVTRPHASLLSGLVWLAIKFNQSQNNTTASVFFLAHSGF